MLPSGGGVSRWSSRGARGPGSPSRLMATGRASLPVRRRSRRRPTRCTTNCEAPRSSSCAKYHHRRPTPWRRSLNPARRWTRSTGSKAPRRRTRRTRPCRRSTGSVSVFRKFITAVTCVRDMHTCTPKKTGRGKNALRAWRCYRPPARLAVRGARESAIRGEPARRQEARWCSGKTLQSRGLQRLLGKG